MDASYIRDQVQWRAGCFLIHAATIRGLLLPGIFFLSTRAFCHSNLERAKLRLRSAGISRIHRGLNNARWKFSDLKYRRIWFLDPPFLHLMKETAYINMATFTNVYHFVIFFIFQDDNNNIKLFIIKDRRENEFSILRMCEIIENCIDG